MENRFNIVIGVEDNETGSMSYEAISREAAKVVAMALDMEFKYDPEADEADMLTTGVDIGEGFSEREKEGRLLISRLYEEEIISNEEYRFKLNAQIEVKRYDNYYYHDEDLDARIYYSAQEGYREELDKLTDAIDKLP